jgi:hypothetical protein
MRFYEISSGVRVPVDAEQQEVLDQAIERRSLRAEDLPEREAEVARLMVSRGLLLMSSEDAGTIYRPNSALDLWRM